MKRKKYRMKNLLLSLILSTASLATAEDAPPPVDQLLMTARYVTTLQKHDLKGQLRKNGKKVPVILFMNRKQGDIQFQYLPEGQKDWKKARIFHMRLKANRYDLFELKDGKTLNFPASKLSESIEKTDLTYDDLAMRFLYWPGGVVTGSEKIKRQDCWNIRLNNPGKSGLYRTVVASIHKKAGALMQVYGYDAEGRTIKQFQISDLMKVGKSYTLRRMRVNSYDPVSRKIIGTTYVEFEKPKASLR
jgi:hypothetical protein